MTYSDALDPITVCNRIEILSAEKPMDLREDIQAVLDCLLNHFPDTNYLTAKKQLPLISIYASALYIQIARLSPKYDLSNVLTKSGGLSGISKRGFTKKILWTVIRQEVKS